MKLILLFVFATLVTFPLAVVAQSANPADAASTILEQEFKQLIQEMQDARIEGDKGVAERTLADGYISTLENGSNGADKPKIIKSRSDAEAIKHQLEELAEAKYTQSIEDLCILPHGDTVVANYRFVVRLTTNGELVVKQFRVNEVFIKRDGRWQSILYVETVIPGQPFAAQIDTKVYGDYVGEYRVTSKRTYVITREGDKLFFTRGQKLELVPENENTFVQKGGNYYHIIFIRNGKGQVTHLRMREFPGVEYNAIKFK